MWLQTLLWASNAFALDSKWTVGGYVGTTFIPGSYPIALPKRIRTYDFDDDGEGLPDDVDGDALPDATTLERVRTDGLLGISGSYWVIPGSRVSLQAQVGAGRRYLDLSTIALYHKTFDFQTLYALVGGGAGFSTTTLRGEDNDERLRLPGYPLRAEGGAIIPLNDYMGVEGKLFAQLSVPARHIYRDVAGQEQEVSGVPFTYATLGLQLGFVYGQLR